MSLKTDYKIASFHPEIQGFDPGSQRTSNELPNDSVQQTIKTHPEYKHSDPGKYFILVGWSL